MLPRSPSAVLTLLHAQHIKRQAVPQIKRDCCCVSNPLMTAEVPEVLDILLFPSSEESCRMELLGWEHVQRELP